MDSDIPNADQHLHVEFYVSERKNSAGKPYCRIMVPGDKNNIWDQPVKDSDKMRFPLHWARFQQQTGDLPSYGTNLKEWQASRPDDLTDEQIKELQHIHFLTAEQIATASDGQLQRIGMGGIGLRIKAQDFLKVKRQGASSTEMEDMKKQLSEQSKMIAELLAKPKAGKPGRPAKVAADVA